MERTRDVKRIFQGRVLNLEVLEVELDDGTISTREIVRHVGAVGVLARRADGAFLFVRQYRKAVEAEAIEVCAGLLEAGETPADAARRELREETGHRAARLVRLGTLWSSPGYTDEAVEVFFADCEDGIAEATRPDEDERVETLALQAEEVEDFIRHNRIRDAKTIAAWTLYRLRSADTCRE